MATCEGCCHLTDAMLNLAAKAADRARIRWLLSKKKKGIMKVYRDVISAIPCLAAAVCMFLFLFSIYFHNSEKYIYLWSAIPCPAASS
jgi:hypothetical protein